MSSEQAQQIINEASNTRNTAHRGKIINKAKRYLRKPERLKREAEMDRINFQLSERNEARSAISGLGRQDLIRYRNTLQDELESDSPPKLSGDVLDHVVKQRNEAVAALQVGMPTIEEMRRNPPGAVAKHQNWERRNKPLINQIKNFNILIDPESDDPDLCNIERYRPSQASPGAATFMPDAQIPGHFAMTPLAKANWPLGEAKVDTALAQAERRELEELAQLRAENAALKKHIDKKAARTISASVKRWTCEKCNKEMPLYEKGVHIAKHNRFAKAEADAAVALEKLQAENAAREQQVVIE